MTEPKTVDVTPTWRGVIPLILAALENGTDAGRRLALSEIGRMAEAADKWNAHTKQEPARLRGQLRDAYIAGYGAGAAVLEGDEYDAEGEADEYLVALGAVQP